MTMKFEQLKSSLASFVERIYLIEGEEAFFRARAAEMIKNAAMTEPDLNYALFSGADIKQSGGDDLVVALRSCPFMSENRVVEVSEWYPSASELKAKSLKDCFSEPSDTSVLLIVNEKPCDALKKCENVTVVDCSRADLQLIVRFIRKKAGQANLIVSTSVAEKIAEFCQFDMVRIDGETNKLIDYCKDKSEIDMASVELLVTKDAEYKSYEIVNFIAGKNYTNAYKIISEMRTPGEKQMLLVSLYSHFRRMFYCATTKESDLAVADKLGVKEYAVKKSREQAAYFSPKRLKVVMDKLAQSDADFKSGKKLIDNVFYESVFTVLTEGADK